MKVFPTTIDLPKSYMEGIGRICVNWAFQERQLANITYGILGINPKQGRVSVRSPRASENLLMIQQLLDLENIKVESIDISKLVKSLQDLERLRDMVAHGVWLLNPQDKQLLLQSLSGNWKPDPKAAKVARRIKPEGVAVNEGDLNDLASRIKKTIDVTKTLSHELAEKISVIRKKSNK
jgi:hypothetical protein